MGLPRLTSPEVDQTERDRLGRTWRRFPFSNRRHLHLGGFHDQRGWVVRLNLELARWVVGAFGYWSLLPCPEAVHDPMFVILRCGRRELNDASEHAKR
jgi:hypothetical protein